MTRRSSYVLPGQRDVPLSWWSSAELAAQAVAEGLAAPVSVSTVRCWLHEDAIKPWQHRSWIFPRDPDFAAKAARVLDLYARTWGGRQLGDEEYMISADEKSRLQALSRRHPGLGPGPGRTRRVEFEYTRGSTLAYFGAYDVHRAQLIGRVAKAADFADLDALAQRLTDFEPRYHATATPFDWRFGRTELNELLQRIDAHPSLDSSPLAA